MLEPNCFVCHWAVATTALSISEASMFTLNSELTMYSSHHVSLLLFSSGSLCFSYSWILKYLAVLLKGYNIQNETCPPLNLATFLSEKQEELIHDYSYLTLDTYSTRTDLRYHLLDNADWTCFSVWTSFVEWYILEAGYMVMSPIKLTEGSTLSIGLCAR